MVLSPISPCSSIGCCSCFLILDGEFLLPLHIFSSFLVCFRLPLVLFPVLGWWKLPTRGHYMKKAYCFSCVFSVACIVCVCVRIRACVAGYFPFLELVSTFVLFILYCASPSSLPTFHCQVNRQTEPFHLFTSLRPPRGTWEAPGKPLQQQKNFPFSSPRHG